MCKLVRWAFCAVQSLSYHLSHSALPLFLHVWFLAVLRCSSRQPFHIDSIFSHETVTVVIGGQRIIRSPTDAIYAYTGCTVIRSYRVDCNKIAEEDFDLVD